MRYHKYKKAKCAFGGEHSELQIKILKDFTEAVQNLICNGHIDMIDFQHGIVVSNTALPQLYDQLVIEYQVKIAICLSKKIGVKSFINVCYILWKMIFTGHLRNTKIVHGLDSKNIFCTQLAGTSKRAPFDQFSKK